jgi:hypothetical protein
MVNDRLLRRVGGARFERAHTAVRQLILRRFAGCTFIRNKTAFGWFLCADVTDGVGKIAEF